jgi:hypothetical protein
MDFGDFLMTATSTRQRIMERPAAPPSGDASISPEGEKQRRGIASTLMAALPWVFGAVVTFALFAGYRLRHLELFTPKHGTGYWLGIIGASMMLLLLLYPLRKRVRGLAFLGSNRFWFSFHMVLGVLGPLFILYHANFSFGSTNSNVALVSMLVVAGSGLVGRFIYAKIHYGLYGRKASLSELRGSLDDSRDEIAVLFSVSPDIRDELFAFSERTLKQSKGFLHSLVRLIVVRFDAALTQRRVHRIARRDIAALAKNMDGMPGDMRQLTRHIDTTARAFVMNARAISGFTLYERLFSLWHVLHLPLFFMLVIAATVHVIAAHFY